MAILKYKNEDGNYVPLNNYLVQPITPVQSTGSSATDMMSQAAVTDALNTKVDKVTGKSLIADTSVSKLEALPTNDELNSTIQTLKDYVNQLTNGNYDWYGVSWYDSTSSPDLTRVGNLNMHKELPIQNMMQGCVIRKINGEDVILPLNSTWTALMHGINSNTDTTLLEDDQYFVKIPEFWYYHYYDATTGYHELRICQHAKAGWQHHEEAYVSAYEGILQDSKYMSLKGVTPSVSFSRTTARTAVRANGNDGEAKWNIYTYREHRAICHLFLVEYATRHSQKAVNNTLTTEGYMQGGLGSGCTTGTVTIGGATKYAYIPTGTTDTLGNGSGQVSYTVQQTDSTGADTTTVVRYACRYRGVENPFGHIWKHCDDIISVYADGARTWYMCDTPSQFATNKNSYYHRLCSSTCVSSGYKKTIRSTEDCDYFAEAVGGAETTYWADYNYDNTDTTEHCLLIGGRSGDGGWAGLFALDSHGGVSCSGTLVGSRLVYLPNA
jgi:hypothetical protein